MIIHRRFTDRSPSYDTAESVRAVFRLYTDEKPPLELVEAVERVGGVVKTSLPPRTKMASLAEISSENRVDSLDLRDHLDWIIPLIEAVHMEMEDCPKEVTGVAVVYVNWWSKRGEGGPAIWPEQMRKLAELDLELVIDVSFYGRDS